MSKMGMDIVGFERLTKSLETLYGLIDGSFLSAQLSHFAFFFLAKIVEDAPCSI